MANNIEELIIRLNDQVTGRLNGISNSLNGVRNASNNVNGGFSKLKISGAAIGTAVAAGAAVAIGALSKIGYESVTTALDFEKLTRSIKFASGSAEEGALNLQFINDTVDRMNIPLLESMEGFKQLSGAMMGSGADGEQLRQTFEAVSSAVATMGLSGEEAKGSFLAIGQIFSKGTVSAEELRGQLAERVPGAMAMAARATGMSVKELGKQLQAGALESKQFMDQLSKEMIKTFGPGVEAAAKSSQGTLNKLNNTLLRLKVTIGDALLPTVMRVFDSVANALKFIQQNFERVKEVFRPLTDFFKEVFKSFSESFAAAFAGVSMQDAFNRIGTFFKNIEPWLKIVLKYYKLVAEVVAFVARGLYEVFHVVGAVIKGLTTFLKGSYGFIMSIFKPIYDFLITKLIPAFSGVRTFFEDLFGWVKGIAGTIINLIEKIPVLGDSVKSIREGLKTKDFFQPKKITGVSSLGSFGAWSSVLSGMGKTPTVKPLKDPLGSGVDTISGSAPKVINISIDKIFNGGMDITTNTFGESVTKIKEELTKALLSSINDVNLIGG